MNEHKGTYYSLKSVGRGQITRRGSKFIATASPASDEDRAKDIIDQVARRVPDASHHAYAYRLGTSSVLERYSDDGEPSKTAGMPILNKMQGEKLTYSVVIVSRVFGGTLLGTGGLARAYGDASAKAIENAGISKYVLHQILEGIVPYTLWGQLEYGIKEADHLILDVNYGKEVDVKLAVSMKEYDNFIKWMAEETSDSVQFEEKEKRYLPRA